MAFQSKGQIPLLFDSFPFSIVLPTAAIVLFIISSGSRFIVDHYWSTFPAEPSLVAVKALGIFMIYASCLHTMSLIISSHSQNVSCDMIFNWFYHREKEEACKELLNTLKYKSSLVEDLEAQLAKVIEKNTELTIQNSDLQKKVVELREVTDECEQLKTTLTEVETECTVAKSEVKNLGAKVRNLECVLEEMHKAAENRREIERQHKEALEKLKQKQGEVEIVATKKQAEIIEQMKQKITELEVERKVQNEKHQELILEMADLKRYGRDSLPAEIENPSDNIEIDQIMAKLEQDNKFLADLEKQRADRSKGDSPPHRAGSAITDSGFLSQSSLNGASMSPVTRERAASLNRSALELPGLSGADKINLLSGSFSTSALNTLPGSTMFGNSQEVIVDKDGMVEIPGKGWCWVYLARYSYDPFQHSPNDTPEAELAINAGDYILVWSDPDEVYFQSS